MVPATPEKPLQEVAIAGSIWGRIGYQLLPTTVRDGKNSKLGLQIPLSIQNDLTTLRLNLF